jgi:hypothetical protein
MQYTTSDWHDLWYSYENDYPAIHSGELQLKTSTHDSYRFDLATGAIVGQFRLWRTLAKVAWSVIAIGLLAVALLLTRWRRRAGIRRTSAFEPGTEDLQSTSQQISKPYRYSLRSLLVATTVVAVLCLTLPRWPHVVLLAIVVMFTVLLTRSTLQYWGHPTRARRRSRRMWEVGLRFIATATTWLCCYILSFAPILSFLDWHAPEDVRMAVLLTLYRPIFWIRLVWPDVFTPLEWYLKAWGIH